MTFTDTHCHLADPKLADTLPAVLAEAQAAGVARFYCTGYVPKRLALCCAVGKAV